MWESIKAFFRRHRRKLFVTGAIVGGVYLLGRYARWRLAEWQREREMEYVEQARKQHHFESNLRTCTVTFFSLVPSLRDALMEKLDCEANCKASRKTCKQVRTLGTAENFKLHANFKLDLLFMPTVCVFKSSTKYRWRLLVLR